MGCKNSKKIPTELIKQIQEYVEGETVYIPKRSGNRRRRGDMNGSGGPLDERNAEIWQKYKSGVSVRSLSEQYYISPQGIYKILTKFK